MKYCMNCWNNDVNKMAVNNDGEEVCLVCGDNVIDYIYNNNQLLEKIKLANELSKIENNIF